MLFWTNLCSPRGTSGDFSRCALRLALCASGFSDPAVSTYINNAIIYFMDFKSWIDIIDLSEQGQCHDN